MGSMVFAIVASNSRSRAIGPSQVGACAHSIVGMRGLLIASQWGLTRVVAVAKSWVCGVAVILSLILGSGCCRFCVVGLATCYSSGRVLAFGIATESLAFIFIPVSGKLGHGNLGKCLRSLWFFLRSVFDCLVIKSGLETQIYRQRASGIPSLQLYHLCPLNMLPFASGEWSILHSGRYFTFSKYPLIE